MESCLIQYTCIETLTNCKLFTVPVFTLFGLWMLYISSKLKEYFYKLSSSIYGAFNSREETSPKPNYMRYLELSKKYGKDVLWLNKTKFVLNSAEAVKEAFHKGDVFSGRSPNFSLGMVSKHYKEALKIMHERNWKILRRFAHKALLKQAIRNEQIDNIIQSEVQRLIKTLKSKSGQQIDATNELMLTVVNISAILVFGERFEKDDDRFECIKEILSSTFSKSKKEKNIITIEQIKSFFNRKQNLSAERMLESFIKAHLNKKSQTQATNIIDEVLSSIEEEQTRYNIKGEHTKYFVAFSVVFEVFFSSLEPVIATLQWSLLYLSRWHDYQKIIQEEFSREEQNINRNSNMLNAVIHETQRKAIIVPLYPRACAEDSTINGHEVKKGTTVMINTYALHYDENVWENSDQFQPERWLNAEGNFQKVNSHNFIPFGGGLRRCIGEQLAGKELQIIMKEMLNNFNVKEPVCNNFELVEGTFNVPQTFQLVFEDIEK